MSSSDILIVGAGCFGLSTALHLKRRGVENVQLIDRLPFPSRESASTIDTSRIIRADYVNPFYAKLGQEALEEWKNNPTFSQAFHETGWILAALPGDHFVLDSYNTLKGLGAKDIDFLDTQGVRKRFPGLNGNLDGSDVYFNPRAGWANARQAMQFAMAEFVGLGGRFLGGDVGDVISILADSSNRITGVQAKDGSIHRATKVIVCTGASTPQVVDIGNQIHPMGFCLAHWRLDAEEMAVWKDHPVVDLHHNGYFFPPNEEGLMKLGYGMSGYQRYKTIQGKEVCIPWWKEGIPAEAESGIRSILRKVAPSIADKHFFDMRVCWDGMTADAHWLITEHPTTEGLFIAAGGSGHGFKFLPVIGNYIANLLQGKLDIEFKSKWQWRKGTDNPHVVIQGRPIGNLDSFPEASKSKI